MMKKITIIITLVFVCIILYISLDKKSQSYVSVNQKIIFKEEEINKISEILAHLLYQDLHTFSPHYNFDEVLHIMTEINRGLTELQPTDKCRTALMVFEDKILQEEERRSLENLSHFFDQLLLKGNVIEVEHGKLYYEIIESGLGDRVAENSTPLIHFTEYDLTGNVFRDTRPNQQKKIALQETIPGFKKSVVGMRKGEKRKIYIHPDLAYGRIGRYSKQLLLIFEVEILDID